MRTYSEKAVNYTTQSTSSYVTRISVPAATIGGILLIIYFMIIKVTGMHMQTELRWVNFILIIPFVIYAINRYVSVAHNKSYLEAFWVAIATALCCYLVLAIFMVVYLYIDTAFMEHLYQQALPELQLTPLSIFVMLMGEGTIGGVVISFVTLQFFIDRIRKVA